MRNVCAWEFNGAKSGGYILLHIIITLADALAFKFPLHSADTTSAAYPVPRLQTLYQRDLNYANATSCKYFALTLRLRSGKRDADKMPLIKMFGANY